MYLLRLLWLVWVALDVFRKLVYPAHLTGNVYALRAMLVALLAADAMVCLAQFWHAAVIAYEIGAPVLNVFRVVCAPVGHVAVVYALVEMAENGRNVDAVWTRHAIVALIARYCL